MEAGLRDRSVRTDRRTHRPDTDFKSRATRLGENEARRAGIREQRLAARKAGDEKLNAELGAKDYRYRRLGREVFAEPDSEQKRRLIFEALLTRPPSSSELQLAAEEYARFDHEQASANLIWSLLDSRQFLFIR